VYVPKGEGYAKRPALTRDQVKEEISEIRQAPVPTLDTDVDKSREPTETVVAGSIEPQDLLHTESLDLLDEDLLKNERVRPTGFVGKNLEVHWLRIIIQRLERTNDESVKTTLSRKMSERCGSLYGVESIEMSVFAFYLNNGNVDLDFFIDLYSLLMPETVERLLGCYMTTVHDSFPILLQKRFKDEFLRYFKPRGMPMHLQLTDDTSKP
jgi:hypothetical protein